MKALVTGGAGFIGSHICELLLQSSMEVVVVDNLVTGKREHVPESVSFYELDIRDPDLERILAREKPEVVFHQAALADVRGSFLDPVEYASVNLLGSLHLLECCRKHDVRRVIYASTGGAVYGDPAELPVKEDHPISPLDPYGASKHHVEHHLELARKNFGLAYVVLRYPNVFGPRQDPLGEAGVIAIFARRMLLGDPPVIHGDGRQERDFVYVSDVARANLLALQRGEGRIFNIGSGKGTSVNQLAKTLQIATGYRGEIEYGEAKQGEVRRIFLESSRAREELGWVVSTPLEEGISRTVESIRSTLPERS